MTKKRTRLRTITGHSYPVGESRSLVKKAGGIRKLTEQQRASLKIKQVVPGGWIDDMPYEPRKAFLARGTIEEIEVDANGNELTAKPRKKAAGKRRRKAGK